MSKNNIAKLGLDGWIFLVGGTNEVLEQYTSPEGLGEVRIVAWINLLKRRAQKFSDKGIKYIHIIAPEKLSVYPEYFGDRLECFELHPIAHLMSRITYLDDQNVLSDVIINPLPYFMKQKKDYLLYWKTDTHWRFEACFSAYQLICNKLGVKPLKDLHLRPFTEGFLTFDLGDKFDSRIQEKGRFYNLLKNAIRVHANKLVKYKEANSMENEGRLHVGSLVVFQNAENYAHAGKVIVFGDSFSECRTNLLTGMLAETFKEVHFIWSTSIDFDYIQRHSPDIVISEIAERFMTVVPSDAFDVESYCNKRLDEFLTN